MMDGTRRLSGDGPVNNFLAQSSFATKAVVHESAAVPVDEDVPFEEAALLGCGATTGLGAVLNTAGVTAGESVAVFGCGGVGMSAVMAANAVGADPIIAVDAVSDKLDVTEDLGATHTVDAASEDPAVEVDAVVPGGVDYAFESIGNAETIRQSFQAIRPGGTAVVTGAETDDELSVDPMAFLDDKRLIGNLVGSCRPHVDIPRFVDMHRRGAIDLGALHTRTLPLADLEVAFREMEAGKGIRTVLSPE